MYKQSHESFTHRTDTLASARGILGPAIAELGAGGKWRWFLYYSEVVSRDKYRHFPVSGRGITREGCLRPPHPSYP